MSDDQQYGDQPEVQTEDTTVVHGADGPPADDQPADAFGIPATFSMPGGLQGMTGRALEEDRQRGGLHLAAGGHVTAPEERPTIEVERTDYPYPLRDGMTTLPMATAEPYDVESESHVEVTVRVGGRQLILREEYPRDSQDEADVLANLAKMGQAYLESRT